MLYQAAASIEMFCGKDLADIHASQRQAGYGDEQRRILIHPGRMLRMVMGDVKTVATHSNLTGVSVADMVAWIFNTRQITRGYNTASRNCKDFAMDLWNHFTPQSKHVKPHYRPGGGGDTWI